MNYCEEKIKKKLIKTIPCYKAEDISILKQVEVEEEQFCLFKWKGKKFISDLYNDPVPFKTFHFDNKRLHPNII